MSEHNGSPPRGKADHLKGHRFEPGRSGNPGGRPKGRSVAARLRALLEQEHGDRQVGDILAERLLRDALLGKLGHVKEVLDRTEGAARQTVEVTAAGCGGTILLVPPEGATDEQIERMGAEAAARLPTNSTLLIGRCWMEMLVNQTKEGGASVLNADRPHGEDA